MRLPSKIIAFILSVLQVWVPTAVLYLSASALVQVATYYLLLPKIAFADPFSDAAQQGQSTGLGLVPNVSGLASQDASGNLNLNWQGKTTTFAPSDLFPDEKNTSDPNAQSAFGSDAQVVNLAHSQTDTDRASSSSTGQAYQMLIGSMDRARVDMSSDPIWSQTDQAINEAYTGDDSNCQIVTVTDGGTTTSHVPDYQTCERVLFPGGECKCRHDYTVDFLGSYSVGVKVQSSGTFSSTVTVNLLTGQIVSCPGCMNSVVYNWTAPPADLCTSFSDGEVESVSAYRPSFGIWVEQTPDCSNGFVAGVHVQNTSDNPEWLDAGTMVFNFYHVVDNGWTCDPGCEIFLTDVNGDSIVRPACTTKEVQVQVACTYTLLDSLTGTIADTETIQGDTTCDNQEYLNEGYTATPVYDTEEVPDCSAAYTCSEGPCSTSAEIGGYWVDQSILPSTNPFALIPISNLAHEVTITLQDWNQGTMPCWTDPQGVEHCPDNDGSNPDTCGDLESNPNCSFVSQQCIEGAEDPTDGTCYAWTVVYDCGYDVSTNNPTTTTGYECDGIIRCMGEDCVNGEFDPNNTQFGQAAGMLQVLQYAASDLNCTGSDCKIWTGQTMECKKALGGYVDCCQEPKEGVSLSNYIQLLTASYEAASINWDLTDLIPGPFGTNPLNGAWTELSNAYYDVENVMNDMFTSAWDNLVGNASDFITEAADSPMTGAGVSLAGLTQKLMNVAYDFINNISPDLASEIFTAPDALGNVAFSAGMQTLISIASFISWMYTIYQIIDILIHIIWACTQDELQLGAKREMKDCHYVGSHCVGFLCIQKNDTYCCYNSPLARIMQEQIRKQGIDEGWGSAKHPRCGGLPVSELASVDWSQVDLSEWLGLLTIGGDYPTQRNFTLDGLTGSGSGLNYGNTGAPRPDAATRVEAKINASGQDLEKLRIKSGLDLWGGGRGTLTATGIMVKKIDIFLCYISL